MSHPTAVHRGERGDELHGELAHAHSTRLPSVRGTVRDVLEQRAPVTPVDYQTSVAVEAERVQEARARASSVCRRHARVGLEHRAAKRLQVPHDAHLVFRAARVPSVDYFDHHRARPCTLRLERVVAENDIRGGARAYRAHVSVPPRKQRQVSAHVEPTVRESAHNLCGCGCCSIGLGCTCCRRRRRRGFVLAVTY